MYDRASLSKSSAGAEAAEQRLRSRWYISLVVALVEWTQYRHRLCDSYAFVESTKTIGKPLLCDIYFEDAFSGGL